MIAVDLTSQEILKNWEIKQRIAQQYPYGHWLKEYRQELKQLLNSELNHGNGHSSTHYISDLDESLTDEQVILRRQDLLQKQIAFGYTTEDVEMVIQPMASTGSEPTFCMGDDIPLAVLSQKPHLLYDYFKQRFAQVTNPAIDPLREKLVMSLIVELGERGNLLEPRPEYARRLQLNSPVLTKHELTTIELSGFATAQLSTLFPISSGLDGLKNAVEDLQRQAAESVRLGAKILIFSDRISPSNLNDLPGGISAELTYIPPMLAIGAVPPSPHR